MSISRPSFAALKSVDGSPVVLDVHDGDTFTLALDTRGDSAITPALRVRGLFCPELGEDGGLAAWLYVAGVLGKARDIEVTLYGRSFARYVAEVIVDGVDLARTVIAAGHGTAEAR